MCKISDFHIRILEKEVIECGDIKDLMCDYADNELTPTLRHRLDDHMHSCGCCMKFKNEYLQTIQLARQLKSPPLTNDIQNRLRKALNEKLGLNLSPVA